MNLCDTEEIKKILSENNISLSKSLGQNFIINPEICPKTATAAGIGNTTGVLEIGPGIGTLTKELCSRAGKVVAVEADGRLPSVLEQTLSEFHNFKIICGDFLKIDLEKLIAENLSDYSEIKVCANLPYYITTPIITKLLKSDAPINSITIMLQKEAAERITAKIPGRGSSAITIMVAYYAEAQYLFSVGHQSFYPEPKVDSAVINITPRKNKAVAVKDEGCFFKTVNAAFTQRRKKLSNALSGTTGTEKGEIEALLTRLGINPAARPEELTLEEFAAISDNLYN